MTMADDKTKIIIALAEALQTAITVGNPAPVVQRLSEWMRASPQPGDLVIETSTMHRGASSDRVGFLLRTEDKRVCRHERDDVNLEQCEACPDDERMRERFTWIGCLDSPCGRDDCADRSCVHRHRWYNASFLRLPSTVEQLRPIIDRGISPGGIDRAGLVGVLGDAGFNLRLP